MNKKVEEQVEQTPELEKVEDTGGIVITVQDLMVVRGVIDAATRGGVLDAGDLSTVGMVHDKIHALVEDFLAKQKAQEPEPAPVEGEVKE